MKVFEGKEVSPQKQTKIFTTALTAVMTLNKTILPGCPEGYISSYQVDMIAKALELEPGDIDATVSERHYPIMMEFQLAIEGCRAGLFQADQLGLRL